MSARQTVEKGPEALHRTRSGCRFAGPGVAGWSCHPRAHPVEQNGSPFLTATSGRSPPQHGQRPSRRGEGSARIDRWLSNAGRGLSPAITDRTVKDLPRWDDPSGPTKVADPASRILFASAPSSRAREARRQASGLGRGSGRRASHYESTLPGTTLRPTALRPRAAGLRIGACGRRYFATVSWLSGKWPSPGQGERSRMI
jgi:hypothetical protein